MSRALPENSQNGTSKACQGRLFRQAIRLSQSISVLSSVPSRSTQSGGGAAFRGPPKPRSGLGERGRGPGHWPASGAQLPPPPATAPEFHPGSPSCFVLVRLSIQPRPRLKRERQFGWRTNLPSNASRLNGDNHPRTAPAAPLEGPRAPAPTAGPALLGESACCKPDTYKSPSPDTDRRKGTPPILGSITHLQTVGIMRKAICLATCLVLSFCAVPRTVRADSTWEFSVQVSATVQASPPQITLSWPQDSYILPNSYTVYRKAPSATSWGSGPLCPARPPAMWNNVKRGHRLRISDR